MGSMIHLYVGNLEIDWGKNNGFSNHSALYQISDVGLVPYYYAGEEDDEGNWEVITEMQEGLSKPLSQVSERLALLGYTDKACKQIFDFLAEYNTFDQSILTFEKLEEVLLDVDVKALSLDYRDSDFDFGEFFRRQIYPRLNFSKRIKDADDIRFDASMAMENMPAYVVLKLLSKNPSALELPVNWAFHDVEENGWAKRDDLIKPLDIQDRFLVVTEGSSDALILSHALKLLMPHLCDFFYFVDMQEGYPFSGTGSLTNFVKGLISIGVQNHIIVVFDNDAEGVFNYDKCLGFNVPENMAILKLPTISELSELNSVGPDGEGTADINGKAASIECYLDLGENALIRWTSYNRLLGVYQGELIEKDKYKKTFLSHRCVSPKYDYKKIRGVLDMILQTASILKERVVIKEFSH